MNGKNGINGLYRKMKIQNKLLLFILSFTVLIYLVAFGLVIFSLREKVFKDAETLIQTQSKDYAKMVAAELNFDFDITKGMAWAMQGFENVDEEHFDDFYKDILFEFINRNPNFYSAWVSWEFNAVDPDYYLPYGRYRQTYYRHGNSLVYRQDTLNMDGDDEASLYYKVKQDKVNFVSDPYWYSYTGRDDDLILEVSPCIPLLQNGHYAGLAGTDIVLSRFQELALSIKPFEVGYTVILSNNGTYVGHPNDAFVGQKIEGIRPQYVRENNVLERIAEGQFFSHIAHDNHFNGDAFVSYAPVTIGDTELPWSVGTVVPMSMFVREANALIVRSVIVALLGLLLLSYIIFFVSKRIAKPLSTITKVLDKISIGDLKHTKKIKVKTEDEIGQISYSLNKLIDGLGRTADFANRIGEGALDVDFELLGENDVLGEALLNMRASLIKAKEEEVKRKDEDAKRNWATQGYAMFGEILRQDNDDMETLSFKIIKNLVKYLEVNQGGIFIINDDEKEKYLELKACYAYDRRKYLEKKIEIGEGLVGACFLEKKTIHMKNIPDDYLMITSGLGGDSPSTLLIVPLIVNEEIFGVIEVASFKDFDKHHVEFVEKIGESIASTVSTVKINVKTKYLLEQSQQQAEEMSAQEEEMRQNMEEMHATQEEMARKEHTLQNVINATNKFQIYFEYDFDGIITGANELFCNLSGYPKEELKGKHHSMLFEDDSYRESDGYSEFWSLMNSGQHLVERYNIKTKGGDIVALKGIKNPVVDQQGNPIKVMEFAIDISDA